MCLVINNQKNLCPNKAFYYKVYEISNFETFEVRPLFFGKKFKLRQGIVLKSNRRSTRITCKELENEAILKGIHVCLTKAEARRYTNDGSNRIIVAVTANAEDFVATNTYNNQAVFTKVRFSHVLNDSYNRRQYTYLKGYQTKWIKLSKNTNNRLFDGVEIKV